MLRFVVGPDGTVVPDLAERLPGRGLWLTARRDIVAASVAKRLFARAARAEVRVGADLAERIEAQLAARCREGLGLARRAGQAVAGFEKVRSAVRSGEAGLLLAAVDGAEGGRDKIRQLAPNLPCHAALTAAELGAVFGREHVVHVAVMRGRLAERLAVDAARLAGLREAGSSTDLERARQRSRPRQGDG